MFVEHSITGLIFYRFFCFDFVHHRFPSWFSPGNEDSVCIKMHSQTDIELLYIESGKFRLEVNGEAFGACAGDLVVVNPGDLHFGTVNIRQERAAYHCIKIGIDALQSNGCTGLSCCASYLAEEKMKIVNHLSRQEIERAGFHVYLKGLLYHSTKGDVLSDITAMGNLCLLFSTLFSPPYLQRTPISLDGKQKKRKFQHQILVYLEQNWNTPITSMDAAKALSYSQEYFCKIFKETMGETFSSFLVKLKIHKAKELIETGMPPGDVMNAVGMNNYSYFYRSFRKIYGVSPSKCRKKSK